MKNSLERKNQLKTEIKTRLHLQESEIILMERDRQLEDNLMFTIADLIGTIFKTHKLNAQHLIVVVKKELID